MSQPPSTARVGAPPRHSKPEGAPAMTFAESASGEPTGVAATAPVAASSGLQGRSIVLVGLMGVGKTTIGRGLAAKLRLPFRDADEEVERAAGRSVAEIFLERGEREFRDGERRVIARLLTQEPPHVLAFGGGAFMDSETRRLVRARAVSIWLKADLPLLARRVARKSTRPLLIGKNPLEVLQAQAAVRHPVYAEADLVVEAGDGPATQTVAAIAALLPTLPPTGLEISE